MRIANFLAAAVLLAAPLYPQSQESKVGNVTRPGRQQDGSTLLPNGWSLIPAGKQIPLSTLPMSLALSPDGKYALALNGGYLPPTISVIDLKTDRETARVPVKDAWLGLTFNEGGDKVYVGGGSEVCVFEFEFRDGQLTAGRTFPLIPAEKRRAGDHVGDVLLSPDGRFLYVANMFRNSVVVMNTQTGIVVGEFATGSRPYRLRLGIDGKTLLASHWGENSVGLYGLPDGRLIERIGVGPHPTDLLIVRGEIQGPDGSPAFVARLFVACANTNGVWSLGITAGNRFSLLEQITVSPTAYAPAGSTPTALAVSPEGDWLYVVCSNNNTIVVANVAEARAQLIGVIPTGWYPTAAAVTGGGGLLYLSGKGQGSQPAPRGPDPTRRGEEMQYVAAMQTGSLGILPALTRDHLLQFTQRVAENFVYKDQRLQDAGIPAGNPIPNRAGDASPIQHVIYVIKENRSYDQVLGDIEQGEGDASLVVFDDSTAPNHRRLARQFVLFDNYYAGGDVSADGMNWAVGAIANDYVEKMWPSYYGRRRSVYDFAGGEPAAVPPAGYLWSNALAAKLSVRNYGLWLRGTADGEGSGNRAPRVHDPSLAPHTDAQFPPFDLTVPEQRRVDEFLHEFQENDAKGTVPRLMMVYLSNDHTAGRAPGTPTARAMMAEHDYALGRLVEAVSQSKIWPRAAIFIIEDDAQDGADHVDAHRSVALIASPYAKRHFVDSTHYSIASLLRTIELILGLRPMTQFDAAATPMANAFQPQPDLTPYEAVRPEQSFDEKNPAGAGGPPRRVQNRPLHQRRSRDPGFGTLAFTERLRAQ